MDRQRRKKRIWENREIGKGIRKTIVCSMEKGGCRRMLLEMDEQRWDGRSSENSSMRGCLGLAGRWGFFCVRVFGLWVIVVIGWKEPGLSYPFTVFWLLVSTATISVRTTMSTTWKAAAKACHAQYTNHGLHMVCC